LNPALAGRILPATIKGYQLVLRSALGYKAAAASLGSEKAFEDATKYLVGAMLDSVMKKLEIECMYGQSGYGTVGSVSGLTITIPDADFAPGIWAGSKGMPIEIRDATLATSRGTAVIASSNLDNKQITLDAMPAGTVATDVIFHMGAYGKEFAGIHKILTNTGSLFGIDASQYDLWKGSQFAPSTTSVLSFAILQQAIAVAVGKGLESDVVVLCNPAHWDDLLNEQAALRMYDSSFDSSSAEAGAKSIKFHSQNGLVEIVSSIYVKEGNAFILNTEDWIRVGASDVTFKRPGFNSENFFRELDNQAGYELRCYTDQGVFCCKPARSVLISNIKAS
jgi:hypothetical protein